ncbi:MAG: HD domain-containing protein [Alphaproteobacteria bacterium]|nr:HD domain-containing protein [Alphaproteobacteria bacterium]
MKIYQVGGAVRDRLMGIEPHDIDYVVIGATPQELIAKGFHQVGKNFPVFINPENGFEYALARKEIKIGPKHTDFEFVFSPSTTLEEDMERRDFTCNALAYDEESKTIIDYHNGKEDIKNKILRAVNPSHFIEDPLRVLRLCRFAAQLDFTPDQGTLELASKMVAQNTLQYLSAERLWQEIYKALQTSHFEKFIITARQCGALKEILPEIELLFQTPERTDFHPEGNSGAHTLLCLKQVTEAAAKIKFAVLLHDIGKTLTPKDILPSHHNHDHAGLEIIKKICSRLKIPNDFRDFALLCCKQHMKLHLVRQMRLGTLVDFASAFLKNSTLKDFIEVCHADFLGRDYHITDEEKSTFKQNADFLRKVVDILKNIKASDMPNFNQMPKDKIFAEKFRQFQISVLKQFLNKS